MASSFMWAVSSILVLTAGQTTFYPTTERPSPLPTPQPTPHPTVPPSGTPSVPPTVPPSTVPSIPPSVSPSRLPSTPPTVAPSNLPSRTPSMSPSTPPSASPSRLPSTSPSKSPSLSPSTQPSAAPSKQPSLSPTMTTDDDDDDDDDLQQSENEAGESETDDDDDLHGVLMDENNGDDADDDSEEDEDEEEQRTDKAEDNKNGNTCMGLSEAECKAMRSEDGDNKCGYNVHENLCYSVVRKMGLNGRGGFDDGYNLAKLEGEQQTRRLNVAVRIIAALLGILISLVAVGLLLLFSKSNPNKICKRFRGVHVLQHKPLPPLDLDEGNHGQSALDEEQFTL